MKLSITIDIPANDYTYRVVAQGLIALASKLVKRAKTPELEDHGKVVADGKTIGSWEWFR